MKRFFIIIMMIGIFLYSPHACNAFDAKERNLEVAWEVLHIIDWGQTLNIAKHPDKYSEINPVLGKYPSVQKVNLYMISSTILHPAITYILPKKYRSAWQYITIGISGAFISRNFSIGLGVTF